MKNYNVTSEELRESVRKAAYHSALELLADDEIFVEAITALDNWNGYADGWRAFAMWELDDLFHDVKLTDFLSKINDYKGFNLADEYFVDSWDGLFTVDDIAVWYNDNTDAEEVLDNLIECYDDIAEDINGELSEVVSLLASIDNGEYTPTVGEDIGAEWLENNETLY